MKSLWLHSTDQAVSLNYQLLQGPNFTNTLAGVLVQKRNSWDDWRHQFWELLEGIQIYCGSCDGQKGTWSWTAPHLHWELQPKINYIGWTGLHLEQLRQYTTYKLMTAWPLCPQTNMLLLLLKTWRNHASLEVSNLTNWTNNSRVLLMPISEEDRVTEIKDLNLLNDYL